MSEVMPTYTWLVWKVNELIEEEAETICFAREGQARAYISDHPNDGLRIERVRCYSHYQSEKSLEAQVLALDKELDIDEAEVEAQTTLKQ
jgi:hypothetical protein